MARTDIRVSAIIIEDNKILLIHRFKNGEEYWVFPGGGVEDGESIESGLVREVKEETNLDVIEYKKVFDCYNESDGKMQPFYECRVAGDDIKIIGEEKDKNSKDNSYSLEWVKFDDIHNIWLVPEEAVKSLKSTYFINK